MAAVIGLGAAIVGGLITAVSVNQIESKRLRNEERRRERERRIEAFSDFNATSVTWHDSALEMLVASAAKGSDRYKSIVERHEDFVRRQRVSYAHLILVVSGDTLRWIFDHYLNEEHVLRGAIDAAGQSRDPFADGTGAKLQQAADDYLRALGELTMQLRTEVHNLPPPVDDSIVTVSPDD